MLTEQNLQYIYDILTNDESFCRLLYYSDNPFNANRDDITKMDNYKTKVMNELIRFSTQTNDLLETDRVRLLMYKSYTKLKDLTTILRLETIQLDIYVPHSIMSIDMRAYKIENKIVSLLDRHAMQTGYLDYVDGHTVPIPPIHGYTLYRMQFKLEEGRPMYGKF